MLPKGFPAIPLDEVVSAATVDSVEVAPESKLETDCDSGAELDVVANSSLDVVSEVDKLSSLVVIVDVPAAVLVERLLNDEVDVGVVLVEATKGGLELESTSVAELVLLAPSVVETVGAVVA